jgi:hypothetical protein
MPQIPIPLKLISWAELGGDRVLIYPALGETLPTVLRKQINAVEASITFPIVSAGAFGHLFLELVEQLSP